MIWSHTSVINFKHIWTSRTIFDWKSIGTTWSVVYHKLTRGSWPIFNSKHIRSTWPIIYLELIGCHWATHIALFSSSWPSITAKIDIDARVFTRFSWSIALSHEIIIHIWIGFVHIIRVWHLFLRCLLSLLVTKTIIVCLWSFLWLSKWIFLDTLAKLTSVNSIAIHLEPGSLCTWWNI